MLYKMWKKLKTRDLWVGKTSKSLELYTYPPNIISWKKVTITQKIIFNGILKVYFRGRYLVGFFKAIQYGKMWIRIRIQIRIQSPPWIQIQNLIRIPDSDSKLRMIIFKSVSWNTYTSNRTNEVMNKRTSM